MYSLHAGQTTKTGVRQCLLQDNKTDLKKKFSLRVHMLGSSSEPSLHVLSPSHFQVNGMHSIVPAAHWNSSSAQSDALKLQDYKITFGNDDTNIQK